MNNLEQEIRNLGGRVTKIRLTIIKILSEKQCLLSVKDIMNYLAEISMKPNRSTIFRELLFLTENNIVNKITISNQVYYELNKEHHHHLVCLRCSDICKIELSNHLVAQENEIVAKNGFKIVSHSLEFFGYCQKCQDSINNIRREL